MSKRFLQVIGYLIGKGQIKNQNQFAYKIGASPSAINEIKQGRNRVNPRLIASTVAVFGIDGNFLLTGNGSIESTLKGKQDPEVKLLMEKIKFLERENAILRQFTSKKSNANSTFQHRASKSGRSKAVTKR